MRRLPFLSAAVMIMIMMMTLHIAVVDVAADTLYPLLAEKLGGLRGDAIPCESLAQAFDLVHQVRNKTERRNLLRVTVDSVENFGVQGHPCLPIHRIRHELASTLISTGDKLAGMRAMQTAHETLQRGFGYELAEDTMIITTSLAEIVTEVACPARLARVGDLWTTALSATHGDRSMRIRAATFAPYITLSMSHVYRLYGRLRLHVADLMLDRSMTCTPAGARWCNSQPQNHTRWSPNFPLYYALRDMREILGLTTAISQLYAKSSPGLLWTADHLRAGVIPTCRARGARIKVAFVSRYLTYDHSLGIHIRGIIEGLDRERFHVHIVRVGTEAEHLAQGDSNHYVVPTHRSDVVLHVPLDLAALDRARLLIAALKVDIVVFPEIGMDPTTYFLGFSRYAPTQIATWGFPASLATGQIDYFISADGLEPEAADTPQHHWEQLVRYRRAPPWFFHGSDAATNPDVEKPEYDLPPGRVYMIPQAAYKIHPSMDLVLAEVLRRDPGGILALMSTSKNLEAVQRRFKRGPTGNCWRDTNSFPGAELGDRVLIMPRNFSRPGYVGLLRAASVILDPWPWGGWTTTLQALGSGVPIVTLPTADARGRFTAYVYRQLGVSDLIADNVSHYVDLALRAAKDQRLHDRLRPRLQERMKMTMLENSAALRAWESFMMRAATLAGSVCASGE